MSNQTHPNDAATPPPASKPWWLVSILVLEFFGWLGQAAFTFVIFGGWNTNDLPRFLVFVFNGLVALAIAGVLMAGVVAPLRHSATQRFALVHAGASLLVTLALGVYGCCYLLTMNEPPHAGTLIFFLCGIVALLAIPLGGIGASRSSTDGWVLATAFLGFAWLLVSSVLFWFLGFGLAGITV